jgi:hypothetical protein
VVAASKPKNIQPTTNLVGRIHFPKPKSSHPFNLLLAVRHFLILVSEFINLSGCPCVEAGIRIGKLWFALGSRGLPMGMTACVGKIQGGIIRIAV